MIRWLSACLVFCITPTAIATGLGFPGGIVELHFDKKSAELPDVRYGIREPIIIEQKQQWRILIGIDLTTLPGEYLLYFKHAIKGNTGEHIKFTVEQKNYPMLENSIDPSLFKQRTEYSDIDFSNTQQPTLPLQHPAQGTWSSSFGHQYYDQQNSELVTHNAISLTTTELANVVAPQNAIISRIETGQAGKNTIFLDHGRGLYSIIEGIVDLTVEVGNGVMAGAVIGKLPDLNEDSVPNSLIWQTVINGVFVDPILLTEIAP